MLDPDDTATLIALRNLIAAAWIPCRCIGLDGHVASCRIGQLLAPAERAMLRVEDEILPRLAVQATVRTARALLPYSGSDMRP